MPSPVTYCNTFHLNDSKHNLLLTKLSNYNPCIISDIYYCHIYNLKSSKSVFVYQIRTISSDWVNEVNSGFQGLLMNILRIYMGPCIKDVLTKIAILRSTYLLSCGRPHRAKRTYLWSAWIFDIWYYTIYSFFKKSIFVKKIIKTKTKRAKKIFFSYKGGLHACYDALRSLDCYCNDFTLSPNLDYLSSIKDVRSGKIAPTYDPHMSVFLILDLPCPWGRPLWMVPKTVVDFWI